jgi:glutamate 5-kinase
VGTSTLTHQTGNLNLMRMEHLVRQLADLKNQGRQVILVTSGAIGAGMGRLGMHQRPREIPAKQALAAIGQGILMQTYEKLFSEYSTVVAQVLLTKDDVANRNRYLNARNTLNMIMQYGAVPIINENDTVTFDEIKLGDNDTLAAMVAGLVDADLLVLLSDIDGLYTADPRKSPTAQLIPLIEEVTPAVEALAGEAGTQFGSGGMHTKIDAARIAMNQGIDMVLTNGEAVDCLQFLNTGQARGTLFLANPHPLGSRKGWLAYSARPEGALQVDEGAAQALLTKGKSLLPKGIIKVEGQFERGAVVNIVFDSRTIARGIVNYNHAEVQQIMGRHSQEIDLILGAVYEKEVIHRNNLSLW